MNQLWEVGECFDARILPIYIATKFIITIGRLFRKIERAFNYVGKENWYIPPQSGKLWDP